MDQVALGQPSYIWRFGQERRLEMVRRFVAVDGGRVLDIGCGIGTYVARLSGLTTAAWGIDIDRARLVRGARAGVRGLALAVSESLPFADGAFDGVLLNEVIEHVRDDRLTLEEALRVTRPGGRVAVFAPNRFYPFETHGVYLGKRYVAGNIPLVNYLPDALRGRLVPHAKAYTKAGLVALTAGLPCRWIDWSVIFAGYDNIEARLPRLGRLLRGVSYRMEKGWLQRLGLSHLLVLERTKD